MEWAYERARDEEHEHGLVGVEDQRGARIGRRLHSALPRVRHRDHRRKENRNHLSNCFPR